LDRDLICPCDYAPADVKEFGACYCNLYLRSDFYKTINEEFVVVPERRPLEKENAVLEYFNK
jgi:ferredoxin-thioredoxin reductase catalytic subunit